MTEFASRRTMKAAVVISTLLIFSPFAQPFLSSRALGADSIDVVSYFAEFRDGGLAGLARKTRPVDVRPAKPGEIIETIIAGEGKETQSPPARQGDMVVRNRCPETGNESILVSAEKFKKRYEGPIGKADAEGWSPYRPRGVKMLYVVVGETDGEFSFIAPWGEKMVARPGDAIVQDLKNEKDTYRIQKAAFACTYEIIEEAKQ
jgi:hypothetical protein